MLQDEWDAPVCAEWVACLDEIIAGQSAPVTLAAHSSACALVAHWAAAAPSTHMKRVRGALLVAPSDPDNPNYPVGPVGFGPIPMATLPFPSIVVASSDDRYISPTQAQRFAQAWGSRFELLTNAGHINAGSGHGPWDAGYALLDSLR